MSCHGSLKYREHYADNHASRLLSSSKPIILTFLSRAHERFHSTALTFHMCSSRDGNLNNVVNLRPRLQYKTNQRRKEERATPLPTLSIVIRTINRNIDAKKFASISGFILFYSKRQSYKHNLDNQSITIT